MKKILFFAAAAVAVMTSCSSSDDAIANDPVPANAEEITEKPVAIQLGASSSILSTATRGTGTVGGVTTANNKWNGQNFNVYMFQRGTLNDTIYKNAIFYAGIAAGDAIKEGAKIFTGVDDSTLPDSVSTIRPKDDIVRYYPSRGAFDFYAYRLDSANWNGTALAEPAKSGDSLNVNFTIDGSQDIMVAYADTTTADINAIMTAANITADRDSAAARFFSSYTSRQGIIPTLFFKHLLTRLTFELIPGKPEATQAVTGIHIDGIKVISNTKGKLTIAPVEYQGITNWTTPDTLSLMQRDTEYTGNYLDSLNLVKLAADSLIGRTVGEAHPVGEAMMVQPGVNSYKVIVYLSQYVRNSYSGTTAPANRWERYEVPAEITLSDATQAFEAGKSYTVKITVNGLREIVVKAALDNWKEGETISRNPEDEDFDY